MKCLYKCDHCGKLFETVEECDLCELSHWTIRRGYSDVTDTLDTMSEYKEGQEEPSVIHIELEKWDREKGEYVRRCAKYKLISSYDRPLVIENE